MKTNPANQPKQQHKLPANFYFDHKDLPTLKRFLNRFGQIEGRYRIVSGRDRPILRVYQQRRLSRAIKRARHLALLPFVGRDDGSDK